VNVSNNSNQHAPPVPDPPINNDVDVVNLDVELVDNIPDDNIIDEGYNTFHIHFNTLSHCLQLQMSSLDVLYFKHI
jgi:hypothetical protein